MFRYTARGLDSSIKKKKREGVTVREIVTEVCFSDILCFLNIFAPVQEYEPSTSGPSNDLITL